MHNANTTAQQAQHHSVLQVPVPSAYLGSWSLTILTIQTLHLISGVKKPLLLFSGFNSLTTVVFCVAYPLATTLFNHKNT